VEYGTDRALANELYYHSQTPGDSQLAKNKQAIITHKKAFIAVLRFVDDYYKPLTRLLQRLWNILHTAYESRNFVVNDMYDEFLAALEQAELERQDTPEDLTPEQQKALDRELARRDADLSDWRHSPCPAVPRSWGPQMAIAEDAEADGDVDDVDDDRDSSPTPAPRGPATKDRMKPTRKSQPASQVPPRETLNTAGIVTRSMARHKAEASSSRSVTPPRSDSEPPRSKAAKSKGAKSKDAQAKGRGRGSSKQSTRGHGDGGEIGGGSGGVSRCRGQGGAGGDAGGRGRCKGKGKEAERKRG